MNAFKTFVGLVGVMLSSGCNSGSIPEIPAATQQGLTADPAFPPAVGKYAAAFEPSDMTSAVPADFAPGVALDGTLAALEKTAIASAVTLVTWPEAVPVSATILVEDMGPSRTRVSARPASGLSSRWYALRLRMPAFVEVPEPVGRHTSADGMTLTTRFRVGEEPVIRTLHACKSGSAGVGLPPVVRIQLSEAVSLVKADWSIVLDGKGCDLMDSFGPSAKGGSLSSVFSFSCPSAKIDDLTEVHVSTGSLTLSTASGKSVAALDHKFRVLAGKRNNNYCYTEHL
ncbi:MAG: hypothetical protein ACXWVM_32010 [Polyangiales bacterium]